MKGRRKPLVQLRSEFGQLYGSRYAQRQAANTAAVDIAPLTNVYWRAAPAARGDSTLR